MGHATDVALRERIRAKARTLGFARCGFAAVGPAPGADGFSAWLDAGHAGEMRWMARTREKRADPTRVVASARTVIALLADYAAPDPARPAGSGVVARYARGADYHRVLERRLRALTAWLGAEAGGAHASRWYVDTGPVLEKPWAQRAGLGWQGKHTNLIARDLGSWFFLGELITDLELEDTIFSINFGSLVAKVKHFLNEKNKLQVRTPSAVCAIRGTEFAVEYSKMGKESSVAVFDEGRVAVTEADGSGDKTQEYLLEKNTEIHFDPSHKRFRAIPLSRMGRHRGSLTAMRARLASLKGWKPRSLTKRADLRNQALKRKVIRKQLKERGGNPKSKRGAKARAAAKRAKAARQAAGEEE